MLVIFHDSAVFSPSKTCFPRGYRRRRCRPVLLQSCPETIRNTTLCTSTCRGDDPGARWSCKVHPRSRLCHVRGLEPLVGPGLPPCSPLTPRTTCTVKVLTKLKATDGGAATTIPQVCGGGWVAHSPTQRTVHLWTLPHAPLRLLCFRLLRAVRVRLQHRQGAVRRGQELRARDAGAPLATTVPL